MKRLRLVALTGAGMSAESGIRTFRDSNGLWEEHDIMQVASPEGFRQNPELVLRFYNLRRAQLFEVEPNAGHRALVELEKQFEVDIITQNVDDLHERAGSSRVLHLHGQLRQVRPVDSEEGEIPWLGDLNLGDVDSRGVQLRPHIVWFGEQVPNLELATEWVSKADILLVIGTSLQVYPAAGLLHDAPSHAEIWLIDPNAETLAPGSRIHRIASPASEGLQRFIQIKGG